MQDWWRVISTGGKASTRSASDSDPLHAPGPRTHQQQAAKLERRLPRWTRSSRARDRGHNRCKAIPARRTASTRAGHRMDPPHAPRPRTYPQPADKPEICQFSQQHDCKTHREVQDKRRAVSAGEETSATMASTSNLPPLPHLCISQRQAGTIGHIQAGCRRVSRTCQQVCTPRRTV